MEELREARDDRVGLLRLDRPEVRNAVSAELLVALTAALERLDADESVHVIVLTGGDRFFAAGADIAAMAGATSAEMATRPQLGCWQRLRQIRKPIVAAVNGFALGGGAELVWVCDLIVAGESVRFGQPEIMLGLMPGGGATQRLPRTVGKARAMELALLESQFRLGSILVWSTVWFRMSSCSARHCALPSESRRIRSMRPYPSKPVSWQRSISRSKPG
ncbi:MAG: enoyl-CoA hydratase-related protein [Thermomicrobiales bacterium]